MKKTTIIVMALLVIGTAAIAQTNINTSRSNIRNGRTAVKTASVTPVKQETAVITSASNSKGNNDPKPAKVTTATEAATGKATGK